MLHIVKYASLHVQRSEDNVKNWFMLRSILTLLVVVIVIVISDISCNFNGEGSGFMVALFAMR